MATDNLFLWLLFVVALVIPFVVRRVLISKYQLRCWKANLAAIGLLPSTALAGSLIYIASLTEHDFRGGGGMALIGLFFAVVIPLAAAVVGVVIAEIIEHWRWRG